MKTKTEANKRRYLGNQQDREPVYVDEVSNRDYSLSSIFFRRSLTRARE